MAKILKPKLVKCEKHGKQPAYCCCVHVLYRKAPVAHVDHPDQDCLIGGIACEKCRAKLIDEPKGDDAKKDMEFFKIVCKGCAKDRNILHAAHNN